ncbi:MAG: ABC transporter ATP-binding protein [Clostridiales bacterium]|nr:ABC transporter ATP-binding protein [Clostridiales bacterium]
MINKNSKNNDNTTSKNTKTSKDKLHLFESAKTNNRRGPGPRPTEKPKDLKKGLVKLSHYLKPYYIQLIFAFICIFVATIISIIAPRILSSLTNVIESAVVSYKEALSLGKDTSLQIDLEQITKLAKILIAIYLSNALLNYLQSFTMSGVVQRISKKLRRDVIFKLNKIPLKYYDSNPFGDTLSRVTNDIDTIGQSLGQALSQLISSILMLVFVLIGMLLTSWQLTLTTLVTVPLSVILMSFIIKFSQPHFIGQQKYLGAVNGTIEEIFSGQSIVNVFNASQRVEQEFEEYNLNLRKSAYLSQAISSLMHPILNFVSKVGYVAIAVVGGTLYSGGYISMGTIVAFFVYVNMFQGPIGQLGQITNVLQVAAAASERVFEFLEEEEDADESHKTKVLEPTNVKGRVEFRNVKFSYIPGQEVIKNFNAVIEPGQKVAIVGPTGAGKTTIVNLLMRFYELSEGEILIDGIPIKDLTRDNVRSLFSMVLQDTWLFDGTIGENIIYTKDNVSKKDLERIAEAANINHFIKTLADGFDTKLDSESNVSGGQKQLITIARAMLNDSPMMILDEATSNVDTRTEVLIQEAMDKLTKGRTSFVIAHRLSTIKNADVILVLNEGDIIEQGNHEELLAKGGFYANLYNSQFLASSSQS